MSQARSKGRVMGGDAWSLSPQTSVERPPLSNTLSLQTTYIETARLETLRNISQSNFLGIIRYDRSPKQSNGNGFGACPVVCLDLPQFNNPPLAEAWTSTMPVVYHQAEGVHLAMNDEVLFGALQLEENPSTTLDMLTYSGYRRLLVQARALGYPHLLRVWNYFPHINQESDGLTRYQRFCVGRHQALVEGLSDFPRTLPAGTAVGTMAGPLVIYFLAARQPGINVENPRQVSAYEYPPVYGPRSPSFARATLGPFSSGSHLFIAGTASVVGHASQHIGEPSKQTLETFNNLNVLMTHFEQFHDITRKRWDGQALFKVYVRYAEHMSTVSDFLKEHLPVQTPILYLQGEMCRSDLLLEIEGILASKEDP